MYTAYDPRGISPRAADPYLESRLNWLLRENELADRHGRLFRGAREEEELLLMHRPVAARLAFSRFGLLLGTFPPAALFLKIFGRLLVAPDGGLNPMVIFMLLIMNVACALAGLFFGSRLSRMAWAVQNSSWPATFAGAAGVGLLWGLATGAAGGFPALGIGAIYGACCAVPVGVLAFVLFTPLHRLLARGGMIDARHLRPLAWGVVAVVTALILGM